jgi:hypothetical protein
LILALLKAGLKQTVLGAKYLIYDPFKITMKINVYSWKANQKFNGVNLYPLFLFAGANFTMKTTFIFPDPDISPKIMLITQNTLGDGSWFCYKYYS